MPKLIVFNNISLDGYYTDGQGEMGWAHRGHEDKEWTKFVAGNASGDGRLVFGRVTYQMMASYWPTPMAIQGMAAVAKKMNSCEKIVFSRTLKKAEWNNTTLFKRNLVAEMKRLKSAPGPDLVVLGSGNLVAQLTAASLVDEFHIVVIPVAVGSGRTLFERVKGMLSFTLLSSRAFRNGNVFLRYAPKI